MAKTIDQEILERQQEAARQAGRDGRDRDGSTRGRPELETAYDEGAAEGQDDEDGQGDEDSGPGRTRRAWQAANGGQWSAFKPTSPARPPTRVSNAGGFLAGLMLYSVVVIYIRYGAAGWTGWLKAKFLNQPMSADSAASASGTSKSKGGVISV